MNDVALRDAATNSVSRSAVGAGGGSSASETARDSPENSWRNPSRVECQDCAGSLRMATIGESRVARQAGKNEAPVETAATTNVEATKGKTPKSRISKTLISIHAAATTVTAPINAPSAAILRPRPTIMIIRSFPRAPSAMRVPISTVPRRTA